MFPPFDLTTALTILEPNGNFLFSLKESSSSKFNEAFGFQAGGVVLTENAMTFGNDELAINWSGEPEVENRPGSMFGISNALLGEEQFTANDFEVLQPRGSCLSLLLLLLLLFLLLLS